MALVRLLGEWRAWCGGMWCGRSRGWVRHAAVALVTPLVLGAPVAVAAQPTAAQGDVEATKSVVPTVEERFYNVEMFGGKAGWMRSRVVTARDGVITTESLMEFEIKRGAISIPVRIETRFIERGDGEPVSMWSLQKLGAAPVEVAYTFRAEDVLVETTQNGATTQETKPRPTGEWLTPAAAERFVEAARVRGDRVVTFRAVDPSSGLSPTTIERTDEGVEKVTILGKEIEARRAALKVTTGTGLVVQGKELSDAKGDLVRQETSIGGIGVTLTLASREDAMAAGAAPEVMVSTFVTPSAPIDRPRDVVRATYVVRATDGTLGELPTTGSQRVERLDERAVRLVVDASSPMAAPEGDVAADAPSRASTPIADSADAGVVALARKAVAGLGEGASVAERAEALRRAVHAHISRKTLGVGFATATEVARTKAGDCTEHAVLLVAVLRAKGIPARAASGLIYADQFAGAERIFGYHMWAQALIADERGVARWVDLDATLPDGTPYDATHITLAVSDLAGDDAAGGMLPIAMLLGRISIEVEGVEHR
jgi:transglutaminase-like putative cysteine protease